MNGQTEVEVKIVIQISGVKTITKNSQSYSPLNLISPRSLNNWLCSSNKKWEESNSKYLRYAVQRSESNPFTKSQSTTASSRNCEKKNSSQGILLEFLQQYIIITKKDGKRAYHFQVRKYPIFFFDCLKQLGTRDRPHMALL